MTPRLRNTAWIAFLMLAIASLAALYWQTMRRATPPTPTPEKLTLAVINTYVGSGLALIAAERGFFVVEGLDVKLQPHGAGQSALRAVLKQEADMTTLGNLPLIFATLDQAQLSIIASIARVDRGAGIVARRDHGINRAANLKGKTLGVSFGTDGHFVLGVILADNGIAASDVNLRDIEPRAIVAALRDGGVDAVATWEPLYNQGKKALGAAGISFDLGSGYSFWFHLAGRRDYVQEHPATMQKLLRALLRAERFAAQDPDAAATIVNTATGMDASTFAALRPNLQLSLTLHQGMLTMLEDQARWVIANGYSKAAKMPNFLDSIYLEGMLAVHADAVSIVR